MSDNQHDDAPLDYLRQFGYLHEPPPESAAATRDASADEIGAERRAEAEVMALMEFQSMALLPVTGELDDATRRAFERPRCGFPDRGAGLPGAGLEEFIAFGTRWQQAIVSYTFDNFSPDLDESIQREIVRTSFDRWSAVVPLIFQQRPPSEAADIRIRFAAGPHGVAPDTPFQGPGNVLAHAFFPPPNAGDLAGDVHYDEDETWQDEVGAGGFDLLTVTVHELGHSLGLAHTNVPSSTMNPFYPTPNTPAADDRAGMRSVYRDHIWIASLYRDLLNRRFDDDGLDFWVRQRFGGASPEGIARAFCFSREHSQNIATELYMTLLDRTPDAGGLDFWTSTLAGGTSRQTVVLGFLESQEYLANNPPPVQFVTSLYSRLLARSPDPGGFAFWVQRMNDGATPRDVANGFLFSEEFARRLAREQYQRFLRREPDADGWRFWTDQIQGGLAHQDLVAGFLSSTEYQSLAEGLW